MSTNPAWAVDDDDKCPDPIRQRPTQDNRGYFMLPQSPMDSGYYAYGRLYGQPAKGAYQYATPLMMTTILRIALEWQAIDRRRIGIGDISLANGHVTPDHAMHMTGMDVDVRPLRKDGQELPVRWWEPEYDKAATMRLIDLFRALAPVKFILFNGPDIPFVHKAINHDNHFHVTLQG